MTPRYEFRLFGTKEQCCDLGERLHGHLQYTETECSEAIYFPVPERLDLNLKIRDGRLDVKRRINRKADLELWRPAGSFSFPLDDPLAILFVNRFRTECVRASSATEFVAAIEGSSAPVMHVRKRRRSFAADRIRGELTEVTVNGASLWSFALESDAAPLITSLRRRLSLHEGENVSYPLMLQRLRGTTPLPAQDPSRAHEIPETQSLAAMH